LGTNKQIKIEPYYWNFGTGSVDKLIVDQHHCLYHLDLDIFSIDYRCTKRRFAINIIYFRYQMNFSPINITFFVLVNRSNKDLAVRGYNINNN
ncbi:hypothetical protein BpHYR1_052789, partial [Brachionus plicatilis]